MIRDYIGAGWRTAGRDVAAHWRVDRVTLLLAGLSLAAAGLVGLRMSFWGVGLSNDAVNYIAVARNLLDGEGFVGYLESDNRLYVFWPPLYPMLLAAAGLGVLDPYAIAGPLNAIIFGLTVFAVGQYLRGRVKSRLLWWWGCITIALSIPLIWIASFALSGALFVLIATLALIQCDKYLDSGKTSALIWAAALAALAWQTRYLGVAVPALVGLMLLFQPGATAAQRAQRTGVCLVIAAAPMGLWLLRGYLILRGLTGDQAPVYYPPTDYSLADIWGDITGIIADGWENVYFPIAELLPGSAVPGWAGPALAGLIIAAMTPFLYLCLSGLWRSRDWAAGRSIVIFGGFALAYFIILVAGIMSWSSWFGIVARYLIPLYLPMLVAAVLILDQFSGDSTGGNTAGGVARLPVAGAWARLRIRGMPLPRVMLMAALGGVTVMLLMGNILDFNRVASGGINDFTNDYWVNSDTMRYVRENLIVEQVHTSEPGMVYIYGAGDGTVYWRLPLIREPQSIMNPEGNYGDDFASGRERLRYWFEGVPEGTYVIWFFGWYANDYYDFGDAELRELPELELAADLDDGVIFKVRRVND